MKKIHKFVAAAMVVLATTLFGSGVYPREYTSGTIIEKQDNDAVPKVKVMLKNGSTRWWKVSKEVYDLFEVDDYVTRWRDGSYSVG